MAMNCKPIPSLDERINDIRMRTAAVKCGESRKSSKAQSQAISRYATSRLLAQFTPTLGGFSSIHDATCPTNVVAYRSSPVNT